MTHALAGRAWDLIELRRSAAGWVLLAALDWRGRVPQGLRLLRREKWLLHHAKRKLEALDDRFRREWDEGYVREGIRQLAETYAAHATPRLAEGGTPARRLRRWEKAFHQARVNAEIATMLRVACGSPFS